MPVRRHHGPGGDEDHAHDVKQKAGISDQVSEQFLTPVF
jgi:hypothetical protein